MKPIDIVAKTIANSTGGVEPCQLDFVMAGIEEVVNWLEQHRIAQPHIAEPLLIKIGIFMIGMTTKKWRAKLQEWGIIEEVKE